MAYDQTYSKLTDSDLQSLEPEFESCTFSNCNFKEANLKNIKFDECTFENCDLSGAHVSGSLWQKVYFVDCKLLGMRFEDTKDFLFEVYFKGCQLDYSSFFKRNVKSCTFQKSSLKEVDFTEGNLSGVVFDECQMSRAIFDRSDLSKSDFRTAVDFQIDPEKNNIRGARFMSTALMGLLGKYRLKID